MADWALWLMLVAAAYLIGAVPFGLLLGWLRGVDIREHGSGNIGATNLLRVCGRRVGYAGFALDVAKGAGPVVAAGWLMGVIGPGAARSGLVSAGELWAWIAVGAATMLGHIFPVYLRFKGGKGVATGLGLFLGFWPWTTPAAVGALIVWVIVVRTTRYVSVASMCAATALPTLAIVGQALGFPSAEGGTLVTGWPFLAVTALLGGLVIVKHRTNIARLRAGTESKIGGGVSSGAANAG